MMRENGANKKRQAQENVFIVNESYAGIKTLSDIFADLLYTAYRKQEPENPGKEIDLIGYLPQQTGQTYYGDGAY